MGGESERSEEAKRLQQMLSGYMSDVEGLDMSAENRFDDYQSPFNYENMAAMIDKITSGQLQDVNLAADYQIGSGQSDLAERMASEGVSSSSIKESGMTNVRSGVNRQRNTLLNQIYGNALGAKKGAMSEANKYAFGATQGAQGVDQSNIMNLLRKYGVIGGFAGQQLGNVSNYDETTWMDDVLAVANTAANFIPGGGGGGGGAASGGG